MTEEMQLFDAPPEWKEHWTEDMPEFDHEDERPYASIRVYFKTKEDQRAFFDLVESATERATGEKVAKINSNRSRGIWYPYYEYRKPLPEVPDVQVPPNRYPIYVISKGRWESRMTSKALKKLGIDYRIVVEPQEREQYAQYIAEEKILILPFSNLGQGSIPARNWVWDHAVESGAKRHWILDDNIGDFARLNQNANRIIRDENPFIACERFVDRYRNVGLAGLQYRMFASDKNPTAPFKLNTRIYSCILINHAVPHRWRGRYNEDTDLSLRVLKDGWVTVLWYAHLCGKAGTGTVKGGNDEIYAGDGRRRMAEALREQHPDCVIVTEKWGRAQHHVDYSPFRHNKLIPHEERPGQVGLGIDPAAEAS